MKMWQWVKEEESTMKGNSYEGEGREGAVGGMEMRSSAESQEVQREGCQRRKINTCGLQTIFSGCDNNC